jgi:hypothetical protein
LRTIGDFSGWLFAALLAACLAGCGGLGSKPQAQPPAPTDAQLNVFPQNYRKQIAVYLSQQLLDRADFRGARISQPVLKQVGGSSPRYVVCLQFSGRSEIKNKMALYLAGDITQFIDSTPETCGDAAYQPFTELEQVLPEK